MTSPDANASPSSTDEWRDLSDDELYARLEARVAGTPAYLIAGVVDRRDEPGFDDVITAWLAGDELAGLDL